MWGENKLKIGFDLTAASLEILIAGIRNGRKRLSQKGLNKEIERLVWREELWN